MSRILRGYGPLFLGSWICQVVFYHQLDKFATRDVANKPGVYLIVGPDVNEPDQFLLYIGEGDPVLPRLKITQVRKIFG